MRLHLTNITGFIFSSVSLYWHKQTITTSTAILVILGVSCDLPCSPEAPFLSFSFGSRLQTPVFRGPIPIAHGFVSLRNAYAKYLGIHHPLHFRLLLIKIPDKLRNWNAMTLISVLFRDPWCTHWSPAVNRAIFLEKLGPKELVCFRHYFRNSRLQVWLVWDSRFQGLWSSMS